LVFKDRLVLLVITESPEKWVPRVSKDCPDLKDQEDLREMVDPLERMVFLETLVRSVTPVFQASLDCQDPLVPLVPVVLMELRVMLDPLVPKASKVSQVLKDPSVSPVKRVPPVLPENLVLLDALELVENVVTLEREALLESKDLKVRLDPLVPLDLRVLLVKTETRENLARLALKDFKDCPV